MAAIGKSFVALLIFAAAYFSSYWLLFAQIAPERLEGLATVAALLTAGALVALAWNGMSRSGGILATTLTWAGSAGAIGFCGGFFGPMIFAPQANQGPLLGLLITGPLGFIGGALGGLIYSLWRRSEARQFRRGH